MNNVNVNAVTATNTVTLTNKTLTAPVVGGTAEATGQIGRDTTQLTASYFDNGILGNIPKVIPAGCGVGTQTLLNSTTSDQDYTSVYTFPANTIFTNKVFRLSFFVEMTAGVSAATLAIYLKLGATKVITAGTFNPTDSTNRSHIFQAYIVGRAAAGAAANVSSTLTGFIFATNSVQGNLTDQPVALATSGTLAVTLGLAYSATGSTESLELQAWTLEELN